MSKQPNRVYKRFDPGKDYPTGPDLYYECLRCGDVLSSRPPDSVHCRCHNISIDVDYGRLDIEEHIKARLFSHTAAQ